MRVKLPEGTSWDDLSAMSPDEGEWLSKQANILFLAGFSGSFGKITARGAEQRRR
ncbi:MAG TPA: hypothetical protein VNS22_26945 [Geminicoccus sp.]|uniref:hypothetical protein n=1 Tax=Geminicoccus sp. TaxID=2024832 RepID=UPI002CD9F029|nr:hypothetical protein [Geminicoccus sp.]HWL71998.1 hypothetical protein [Geminicoccus sp.]